MMPIAKVKQRTSRLLYLSSSALATFSSVTTSRNFMLHFFSMYLSSFFFFDACLLDKGEGKVEDLKTAFPKVDNSKNER